MNGGCFRCGGETGQGCSGFCGACFMTAYLQHNSAIAAVLALAGGPAALMDMAVIAEMAAVLQPGGPGMSPDRVDWVSVFVNWELPFTVGRAAA